MMKKLSSSIVIGLLASVFLSLLVEEAIPSWEFLALFTGFTVGTFIYKVIKKEDK